MKLKKSLGQNFLKSRKIIDEIVKAGEVSAEDTVLEIGPGEGVLTEVLLQTEAKVISVEKDDRLIPILYERFSQEISKKKLVLIHQDILTCPVSDILYNRDEKYKVVANIPYYITGQIIRKFLEEENKPISMTLLVQKEVAERIVAKDGKESLLSLSVKVYGDPTYIKTVNRSFFRPQPTVDSAILCIRNIKNPFPKVRPLGRGEKKFFDLIHVGFAHKRKQLLPNLSAKYSKEKVEKAFMENELKYNVRAEDLSLDKWLKLLESLEKK